MEVKNERIALLAAALAIFGLFSLFLLLNANEPRHILLSDLPFQEEGTLVSFSGKIESLEIRENSASIRICEKNCVSVLVSNSLYNPYLLSKGQTITVIGYVREYKGAKVISATKIST